MLFNKPCSIVFVLALALGLCAGAGAQESLKTMAEENGTDWLIGTWKGTMPDGQPIEVTFAWAAGGHAVEVHYSHGPIKGVSLIHYDAEREEVVEFSINSRGVTYEATWVDESGKLMSYISGKNAAGNMERSAVAHSKTEDGKYRLEVYGYENGVRSSTPAYTMELERQEE